VVFLRSKCPIYAPWRDVNLNPFSRFDIGCFFSQVFFINRRADPTRRFTRWVIACFRAASGRLFFLRRFTFISLLQFFETFFPPWSICKPLLRHCLQNVVPLISLSVFSSSFFCCICAGPPRLISPLLSLEIYCVGGSLPPFLPIPNLFPQALFPPKVIFSHDPVSRS